MRATTRGSTGGTGRPASPPPRPDRHDRTAGPGGAVGGRDHRLPAPSRPPQRRGRSRRGRPALATAFRAFDADQDAAVAVLHGEGGVFCSGADLTALGTERGNRAAPDGDAPMGVSRLRLSKPVIAAVSGYAVAGGLELALWCDLRVADESAVFGVLCRRLGVPLIGG